MTRDADGKTKRGTSNTNVRGSAESRRRRKCWLLAWFGDGISCPCYSCGVHLTYSTMEVDKIIPQALGGTYARGNIRPVCGDCNKRSGNALQKLIRDKVPKRTIIRMCRNGEL